jgi:microcystin-dependent protein
MAFLNFVPSGVVFPFAGATAPDGWLLCNGSAVSRSVYATLFSTISSAHGSGDGSTTFNLPDYRGRILRGVDGGIARDPDRAGRTASNAGGNTGDNVGSVQVQATKSNGLGVTNNQTTVTGQSLTGSAPSLTGTTTFGSSTHKHVGTTGVSDQKYFVRPNGSGVASVINSAAGSSPSFGGSGSIDISFTGNADATATVGISGGSFALSGTPVTTSNVTLGTGDNETRPINANVNYIIKI